MYPTDCILNIHIFLLILIIVKLIKIVQFLSITFLYNPLYIGLGSGRKTKRRKIRSRRYKK